jgi:putative DNA primase/helicase
VDITQALVTLFERLPEDRQSYACVRGLANGGAVHRFIACGAGRSAEDSAAEAAQAAMDLCQQKYDVHFCIGLVDEPPEPGKGISDDIVTGLFGFFSDIDFAHEAHANKKRYPPTLDDALWCLPLKPTWTIHTGHGVHAVFLFEEPYFFENSADKQKTFKTSYKLGQAIRNRAHRKGWDLDATHEFTRGFRLPGTFNYKGAA